MCKTLPPVHLFLYPQPPTPAFLSPTQSKGLRSSTSLGLICLQAGLGSSLPFFLSVFLQQPGLQLNTDAGVTAEHGLEEEVCVFF